MCIRDRGSNIFKWKGQLKGEGIIFMCVLRNRQQRSSFLLKLFPGLFSRSPMFSAKPDFSAAPSTAIISKNRVRKCEVVYISDHSTVVKAEPVSYTHLQCREILYKKIKDSPMTKVNFNKGNL